MEMKAEKDNRTWYQNTFDEVHASENLLRKVETMKNENGTIRKTMPKGMIAAAAFAVLVFSNVISYAASGSPWILTITLPGGEMRQIEMEHGPEDGQFYIYEDASDSVSSEHTASTEVEYTIEMSDDTTYVHRLETVNDHTWLILDGTYRVDITDKFQNGTCKGSLDVDNVTWCYEVTGTPENYDIQAYLVTYNVNESSDQ